jgi:hypothetical protein
LIATRQRRVDCGRDIGFEDVVFHIEEATRSTSSGELGDWCPPRFSLGQTLE